MLPRRAYANLLLANLSPADQELLSPSLEPVTLELRQTIETPNRPIAHAYFFESGLSSTVARTRKGRDIEVYMSGREGMSGSCLALGTDRTPLHTFMQIAGSGYRISAESLLAAISRSSTLRDTLLRFNQALTIHATFTSLANARCKLEERLSRWLTMVHDRVEGNTLNITHEFLATMLGVRRPGVTVALHILEGKGLIHSKRGEVIIRDRSGLVSLAEGSYGVPEAEYTRLLGIELSDRRP